MGQHQLLDADEEEESEDYDQEEEEEAVPGNVSLLQRSASSSRMRGLFNTVLQKSASGASMNLGQFKANLTRHLQRRESFTSNQNVAQESSQSEEDEDEDSDCFEDCSEVPIETNNYYRLPL